MNHPFAFTLTRNRYKKPRELDLVVASLSREDVAWVDKFLPQAWTKKIYVIDDVEALLTVPKNKGREAMVYLTYIINHYDDLPDNIHNDDPNYDALPALSNLQIPYLQEAGYVNLRCAWVIGCPAEIRPMFDEERTHDAEPMTKHIYRKAFEDLFPDLSVPDIVAVSCCSQFAVSRETIQRRPKNEYMFFRRWLLDTPLADDLTGRVFEFSWHIIFGKEPVHCPSASECYCKTFGICDMECLVDACQDRYLLPPFSTLPGGWPKIGWDGEGRDFLGPL
ncbi:hypothetical protein F5Y16DRAFT_420518 [Xylariaceae sp. FL0255]|nr:hypothetical protein F5Y16DRAFT_420518 [Xylariaceae sp. FL0255]